MPFDIQHDAVEPLGYLIANKDGEKLLFITDSYFSRYRFKGLNIIAIECNYSLETLSPDLPEIVQDRLFKSHFSLENVIKFLKANDLSKVKEIILIHMSDGNSDEKMFKEKIQALTGKMVRTA